MDKLYIVIPAYNEEANIETIARSWHEVIVSIGGERGGSRLVIVDDGSSDSTYIKLQKLQAELPQLLAITKPNSGHGATLLFAYKLALEQGADYVFQTDSDGQTLPSEFTLFWENRLNYDLQIGYRWNRQDGVFRVLVTKILKLVLFLRFNLWIQDANTPFRLMSASSLREVLSFVPTDHNLSNILLSVFYHKTNKNIKSHPITFRTRQGGVNSINFVKIVKIGWQAIIDFGNINNNLKNG